MTKCNQFDNDQLRSGDSFVRSKLILLRGSLLAAAAGWIMMGCATPDRPAAETPSQVEERERFQLRDIFDRSVGPGDGAIYVVAVASRPRTDDLREVGRRIPDEIRTHPHVRVINVIDFDGSVPGAFETVTLASMKREMQDRMTEMRSTYRARGLEHDPSQNLFAVADFRGEQSRGMNVERSGQGFDLFVYDRRGRLAGQWSELPSEEELERVLRGLL